MCMTPPTAPSISVPKFSVPNELPSVLKSFTREVLRANPPDIYAFGAEYFRELIAASKSARAGSECPSDKEPAPPGGNAALMVNLLRALSEAPEMPPLPVRRHGERLSSGRRGLSLDFLRGVHTFYQAHGALAKVMGDVCKEKGSSTSVCALTRCTGLSLAESVVLAAEARGVDITALVGEANTFFSYSWMGTQLGDMLHAVERTLARLEEDGRQRFVWIDMFCASQNLLSGEFLPESEDKRLMLKTSAPMDYAARKEDTDTIFEDALKTVQDLLLFTSPLMDEWEAPPHPYLVSDLGTPHSGEKRRGPGAITRAWCLFELAKCLEKECQLHVVLSPKDEGGLKAMLRTPQTFGEIQSIIDRLDAHKAQISKIEDRKYILEQVTLSGGIKHVTTAARTAFRNWLSSHSDQEEHQQCPQAVATKKQVVSGTRLRADRFDGVDQRLLRKYDVSQKLGKGAYGVVFKAALTWHCHIGSVVR